MKITEMFLTPNKFSRPQIKLEIVKKIAVHYVGNPNTSAVANRNYFENLKDTHSAYVSSHFVIGLNSEIIQCIPLDEWSYCTNQANGYSISIECCHPDASGKFTEATEKALAELCAYLCEKFGLNPMNDIIRHYDVTGKQCPLYWSPTKYVSKATADGRFTAFKEKVSGLMKSVSDEDTGKLYYVQVGAFKSESLARNYLNEVKRAYPSAFIKTDGLYYVQVGAFRSKSNAEAFLFTVKEQYPNAFIKEI